jgi:hypothetical protein
VGPLDPAGRRKPRATVVVGDVHGELDGLREILRHAGLIDDRDSWSGGVRFHEGLCEGVGSPGQDADWLEGKLVASCRYLPVSPCRGTRVP